MVGNRDHGKVTCIAFRNDPIADVKEMNELIKVDESTALFRRRVIDPKVFLDDQPTTCFFNNITPYQRRILVH